MQTTCAGASDSRLLESPLSPVLLLGNRLSVVKVSSLQTPDVYLVMMSHYGNKILHSISTLTPQRCGMQVPAAPLTEGGGE